jgi:hypothetical protein
LIVLKRFGQWNGQTFSDGHRKVAFQKRHPNTSRDRRADAARGAGYQASHVIESAHRPPNGL